MLLIGRPAAAQTPGWTVQPTPAPKGSQASELVSVACPTTTSCTAVGNYTNEVGFEYPLAEHWNGTSWAVQSTPNPKGTQAAWFTAVSCPSTSSCTAVGSYLDSSGTEHLLAERWNGTSWTTSSPAMPSGGTDGVFAGVTCPSTTSCTAVGDYLNSSWAQVTLAERWTNSSNSWRVESTPDPPGDRGGPDLNWLSCSAATACTTVGDFFNSALTDEYTLAERWNGTSWAVQTSPKTGGQFSSLTGVSCPTSASCAAVGNTTNAAGVESSLAEGWNGSTWAVQVAPSPTGTQDASLSGVACTTATNCTAVGNYYNGKSVGFPLAEGWNGSTWTIQPTPEPSGADFGELLGVACPSTSICFAVGDTYNSSGDDHTFAELYS